jgi:hypothetical protein
MSYCSEEHADGKLSTEAVAVVPQLQEGLS